MAHTILVIEDNPLTRKMLRLTLESEGYGVVEAGDRETALACVRVRRPDLVVLDYVLPDTDGVRLLAEVRGQVDAPDLPALMVTGMVSRLDEIRDRAGPATQVVAKPVEPPVLLEFVQAHLAAPRPTAGPDRSVLVVDDEPLNLKLTALRLGLAGYTVATAASATAALARAVAAPPDAVVSDVLMPGMDGFALCLEIRRHPHLARMPVVLVSSAYVEAADQELARRVGASALVRRTPDLGEAAAALERALGDAPPARAEEGGREGVADLHRERLQVQLERQTARNDVLVRQAAIQATALSVIRGLSEALSQPEDASRIVGDVLVHCLDATGLSTGVLYLTTPEGGYRMEAVFGVPPHARAEAERCFGQAALIRRIVETGQPAAFPGTAAPDPDGAELLSRLNHASLLVVPFLVLGQSFGALLLASDTHDLAEVAWLGFARSLAAQFGQTVALGQSLTRLAASEERRRALMEEANDGILILDGGQRVLEANREALRLLGRPRDEILGRDYPSFLDPGEREDHEHGRVALRESGRIPVEMRHLVQANGRRVPVEVSSSLIRVRGRTEDPVTLSLLRDTSERMEAEAALRAAQARLEHVVSSSPAVLFLLRLDGGALRIAWVSPNVERLLGYAVEEVDSRWWAAQIHPEDRTRVLAEVATIFDEGQVVQEYRFRNKAGSYRWLRAELRLVRDAAGRHLEAAGSWADVSARKEAELRLMESEEQYRLLFENSPHPMWVGDGQTLGFLAVNDAAVRHYGYSREELLSMTTADLRVAEEASAAADRHAEVPPPADAEAGPTAFLGLVKHRKRDGTVIQMEIATSRLPFLGREAWLMMAVDVTEKRSLEAQLAQAQRMESIGRLAGGVAHDFNNVLGVITGYGEMLRRDLPNDARLRKYADDVLTAAQRAATLTRQLLAFSRRQVLQPRVLDLNRVVEEMERMLHRVIGEDVRLVTALGSSLPPIRADAGQLEQVVMNLVVNARDAMPHGGRLLIETRTAETEADGPAARAVVLVVSDSGHGMSPEVQAQAFEPFFTTKDKGKGSGLGLSTVHGIVKQSGGHITVNSEPGRGTTFKVYLPTVDEPLPASVTGLPHQEPPHGTETVLVVEDEGVLREILEQVLSACGYKVLAAPHGLAALEIAGGYEGHIDLLLTDVVLPGLGGRDTAEQLTARRPELKVLYMSGYTDDAVVLHGVRTAEMAFIEKPFTADTLARKVREVLETR